MAKKAIKKFKTAFTELLGKYSYDDLTIVNVSDAAKVTRQSFYYHYESMEDFVFDVLRDELDEAVNKERRKSGTLTATFVRIISACRASKTETSNLYNSSLKEELVDFFNNYIEDLIREQIGALLQSSPRTMSEEALQFVTAQYRNMFRSILEDYISTGMKEKPTDIGKGIDRFVGRSLDQVLTDFSDEAK
ncbi:MAG: TetR family transcriptional regulator [Erysipelotrichaceae bacterium]|nr:TetR family transcriptional regulator [Erysipelotrichaceae bacterium]